MVLAYAVTSGSALLARALPGVDSPSPSPTVTSPSGIVVNEDTATPGLWGLFFFLGLAVAVYFLWRSMNRQLSRITVDDEGVPVDPPAAAPDSSSPSSPPADPDPPSRSEPAGT